MSCWNSHGDIVMTIKSIFIDCLDLETVMLGLMLAVIVNILLPASSLSLLRILGPGTGVCLFLLPMTMTRAFDHHNRKMWSYFILLNQSGIFALGVIAGLIKAGLVFFWA
jgi:hypothetical protein